MLDIPNTDNTDPETYKIVQLQMTYSVTGGPYANLRFFANGGLSDYIVPVSTVDLGNDWMSSVWEFTIEPNPEYELISLAPYECTMYIDEIVVDTICVPEPATLCLLAFGGFMLRRKRTA